jgi:hypothetical protein
MIASSICGRSGRRASSDVDIGEETYDAPTLTPKGEYQWRIARKVTAPALIRLYGGDKLALCSSAFLLPLRQPRSDYICALCACRRSLRPHIIRNAERDKRESYNHVVPVSQPVWLARVPSTSSDLSNQAQLGLVTPIWSPQAIVSLVLLEIEDHHGKPQHYRLLQ